MHRFVLCFLSLWPFLGLALTFPLSKGTDVIGKVQWVVVEAGDTLSEVGRAFNAGFDEMVKANPNLDPNKPLEVGMHLLVPSRFILPAVEKKGIVINLPELRLYYFSPNKSTVVTEPVGIGKIGWQWQTPVGTTTVIQKIKNPSWYPPASVRTEAQRIGYPLPVIVPPGPDNPLGHYAMRLGWRTYLIHGTNRPDGVGKRSSAGCLRLFPEGIEKLFSLVEVGTVVNIINQPIKIGHKGRQWFIEVHKPVNEKGQINQAEKIKLVDKLHYISISQKMPIEWQKVRKAIAEKKGIPVLIGVQPN